LFLYAAIQPVKVCMGFSNKFNRILFKKHGKGFGSSAYTPKHSHDYIPEGTNACGKKNYTKLSAHIVEEIQ
jgi:hypothetical protein